MPQQPILVLTTGGTIDKAYFDALSEYRIVDSGIPALLAEAPPVDLKALHAKIGQLTLENDFLEGALTKAGLLSAKR